MFDIGWPEMLVVAIVLIVIVGPKDLPSMLRTFGRTTAKLRAMAGDFRKQFDDALKEAELDGVKGAVDEVRKLNPAADLRKAFSPMQKAADDVRTGLDAAMRPTGRAQSEDEAAKGSASTASNAKPAEPLKNGPAKATGAAKKPSAVGKAGAAPNSSAKPASPAKAKAKPAKAAAAKPATKSTATPKRAPAKSAGSGTAAKRSGRAS